MWAVPLPPWLVAGEEAGDPSGQLLVYQNALRPRFHTTMGQHLLPRLHMRKENSFLHACSTVDS